MYVLEDRSAADPALRVLKVGSTTAPGTRLAKYHKGIYRQDLTMHLWEVTGAMLQPYAGLRDPLKGFEMAVRKAVYGPQHRLPEDHETESAWRDNADSLNSTTSSNTRGRLGKPPVIPGLGGD